MKISKVKVWEKGKWSVSKNEDKYEGLCKSVLSNLFAKADVAICSYVMGDRVISKIMYIVRKDNNHKIRWLFTYAHYFECKENLFLCSLLSDYPLDKGKAFYADNDVFHRRAFSHFRQIARG